MQTEKAIRARISLGTLELDVFQKPNLEYGFSSTGLAKALSLSTHRRVGEILTSKELEPSTREALGLGKSEEFRLNLAKVSTNDAGNINFIPLNLMILVVSYEAMKGNKEAQAIMFACAVEALERRADAAFNVLRTESDRNDRFIARQDSILQRHFWTNTIKWYLDRHPELSDNYRRFIYSNVSNCLNKALFGLSAKEVRLKLDIQASEALRDAVPPQFLPDIQFLEKYSATRVRQGLEPLHAIKEAIAFMQIEPRDLN